MRPQSLTQTLYNQTQQRFSEQLHVRAAPSAAIRSSSSMEDLQQHSRKRKASSSSMHESLREHSNSSRASHFPPRVLHSPPPQAAMSSSSLPSQSSSLSAMYNRIQPRAAVQSPTFPWNQKLQPLASSRSHNQVAVAVADQQQPVQQRERTSRYLSEGDRRTIISRIEHGEKQVTLAKEYSVSRAAICNLYKNRKEVLTRVDRDPEAKHPKKQRPKKTSAATTGDESPSPSVATVTASPLSSPADEDVDDDAGVDEEDEAEVKVAVKPAPDSPQQQQKHQRLGRATSTTSTITRTERALATEDFSGPMETVLLPHSASFSSLSSSASTRSAPVTRESPQPSSSASLEQHRRIKPFLVHEASVYSLPIKKLLSSLRNAETHGGAFRHHADRVMRLLVEEALGCLPQRETDILTPYGDAIPGIVPTDERDVCAISMEAVGEQQPPVLLRAFADVQPLSSTGVLTLSAVPSANDDVAGRYEERSANWRVRARLPPVHRDQIVLLLDLVCGTGERACCALGYLIHEARIAPSSIHFVTVNGAIPGLQRVHHYFPDVSLITAQMDKVVDAQRRIRPGVGNFLERYWGASHYPQQTQTHMDAPRYIQHQR